MQPFTRLTKASVEALRYRGEDIARSITKSVVKEVGSVLLPFFSSSPHRDPSSPLLLDLMWPALATWPTSECLS